MKNKALVVAVHPDDETLGCGGTLLKHKANGDQLFWLIATNAVKGHSSNLSTIKQRGKEIDKVAKAYGFKGIYKMNLPSKGVDTIPMAELVGKISAIIENIKPNIIYLPFQGDVHSDHRYFFQATYSCLKTFRSPFVKTILMMETVSETEFTPSLRENVFVPNYFVDISDFLDTKLKIMLIYKGEMRKHPFPRSILNIRALATYRGATAGCQFAESFVLLKKIA